MLPTLSKFLSPMLLVPCPLNTASQSVSCKIKHPSSVDKFVFTCSGNLILITDTTDVRMVSVLPVKHQQAFHIQCEFIEGSNAQGCMIVLIGTYNNIITKRYQSSGSANATQSMLLSQHLATMRCMHLTLNMMEVLVP